MRQEDVAEVARFFGAEWGRSSIAALEAGNRDLRLEELIVLSSVISHLGGWAEPFIPRDAAFKITNRAYGYPAEAFRGLIGLTLPSEPQKSPDSDSEVEEVMRLGAIETPQLDKFEKLQRTARSVIVFDRILFTLWPDRVGKGARSFSGNTELGIRMAERLRWPDAGKPVPPGLVGALAYGAWGKTAAEERDERTDARGSYETKRALQSARGHVTRELIDELQATLDSHYGEIREELDRLESVIDDEEALNEWVKESYALEDRVRSARYRTSVEGKKPASIFRRRGGKHS